MMTADMCFAYSRISNVSKQCIRLNTILSFIYFFIAFFQLLCANADRFLLHRIFKDLGRLIKPWRSCETGKISRTLYSIYLVTCRPVGLYCINWWLLFLHILFVYYFLPFFVFLYPLFISFLSYRHRRFTCIHTPNKNRKGNSSIQ